MNEKNIKYVSFKRCVNNSVGLLESKIQSDFWNQKFNIQFIIQHKTKKKDFSIVIDFANFDKIFIKV